MAQQIPRLEDALSQAAQVVKFCNSMQQAYEVLSAAVDAQEAIKKLTKEKADLEKGVDTERATAQADLAKIRHDVGVKSSELGTMNAKIAVAKSDLNKIESDTATALHAKRQAAQEKVDLEGQNRSAGQALGVKRKELQDVSTKVSALEKQESAGAISLRQIRDDLKKLQARAGALIPEGV